MSGVLKNVPTDGADRQLLFATKRVVVSSWNQNWKCCAFDEPSDASRFILLRYDAKSKNFVEIADKPRWSNEHVEGAYGFIGGKVNLSCSALAEPGADFTWIKDNRTIQTVDDVEIFNATRHLSILQVTRSSL